MNHETAVSLDDAPLALALPATLPPANAREPEALIRFRDTPCDDERFNELRLSLHQRGDHSHLMLLCWIRGDADPNPVNGAQWLDEAARIALETLQDPEVAQRILSRRLQRCPAMAPLLSMRGILEQQGEQEALMTLLSWAFEVEIPDSQPADLARLSAQLGDLHQSQQRIHATLSAYRRALAYDSSCRPAVDGLSTQLIRAGSWDLASQVLQGELAQLRAQDDPARFAHLHAQLAHIDKVGRSDKAGAASHLKIALDAMPGDLATMLALSELLDHQDQTPIDPNAPTLWAKTARLAVDQGQHSVARHLLERALEVSPNAMALRSEYLQVLRTCSDYPELVMQLRASLSSLDEHPEAAANVHLECAQIYAQQLRQPLLAMHHWEAALSLCPTSQATQPAWDALLRSFRDEGDWEQIASLLRRRLEAGRSPDPYHDRLDLARIYREQLDEPTRAVRVDHQILSEHDLFDPGVSASYKEYFCKRHEWSELQEAILFRIQEAEERGRDQAPLCDPGFAEEFVELADVCERRLGDISGAMDAWQRLAAAYPQDPRPSEQLERLQKRTQVWDSMLANYEQDLEQATAPKARASMLKRYAQIHRDRYRDPTTALALAEEYLDLEPHDASMRRMQLSLLEREGDAAKIASVLEQQLEMGTNPAERLGILRRLCNLYHRQLRQFDKAIASCESQLEVAPRSLEPLRRIEQIHRRTEDTEAEIDAIERQIDLAGGSEQRSMLLRRLARAKERAQASPDDLIEIWERIQDIEPDNALVLERMLQLSMELGDSDVHRVEQTLESIVDRLNESPGAKVARLQELAMWCQTRLEDPDAAEDAWTRVLAISPGHPRALEAVTKLKSERDEVEGWLGVLDHSAKFAPTKHLREQAKWRRVELLAERQGDYEEAIDTLEQLRQDDPSEPWRIHETRLRYLRQTDNTLEVARECEIGLIAQPDPDKRKSLYHSINEAHLERDDIQAAIELARRYTEEFPNDRAGFARLAEYNLRLDRLDPALVAYGQRRELLTEFTEIRDADEHMARLCEDREILDRAWQYLSHPLDFELEDQETWDNLQAFADRHDNFGWYLSALERRLRAREEASNIEGARELYLEASLVHEQRFDHAQNAFEWARRGYERSFEPSEGRASLRQRLWALADKYQLHPDLLDILERELARRRSSNLPEDQVDFDEAYLEAANLAQHTINTPDRAIKILERGLDHLDLHGPVALAMDEACRGSSSYSALESLYQRRIASAQTADARLEHYLNFIDLCERELDDPPRAFTLSLQAWDELRASESASSQISDQALDRAIALGNSHELWDDMAKLYDRLAEYTLEAGSLDEGLDHALECARILRELLQRPVEAVRTLLAYLPHDRDGERLLDPIRDLTQFIASQPEHQRGHLGSLALLSASAQVLSTSTRPDLRIELLAERAKIREQELQSVQGPVVEWMRVLELDPEDQLAKDELARLCEQDNRKLLALFRPAWELAHAQSATQKSDLLLELADLYEQRLSRNEYAFRARLEAYKLQPWLPDPEELGQEQSKLWELAASVGEYKGPALPEDALLRPRLSVPERADEQRWEQLGYSQQLFLDRKKPLPSSPAAASAPIQESPEAPQGQGAGPELEEDMLELVDLEELGDLVEFDEAEFNAMAQDTPDVGDSQTFNNVENTAPMFSQSTMQVPPPVATSLIPGQPVVPSLQGPILGRRPRVDSAWQELSNAYGALASGVPERDAQVLVLQARMWEDSAKHVEAAFQAHEHALSRFPGDEPTFASLEALAGRHDAQTRLVQSIRFLYRRAPSDEVAIPLGLRLADLCLSRGEDEDAIACYRDIIARDAQHIISLRALCRIYKSRGDHAMYSEIYAQQLEVERFSLSAEERIDRALHLADNYAKHLGRVGDAISTLRSLVDDHPNSTIAQDRLISTLGDSEQWSQAVEAMRNAANHTHDEGRRRTLLSKAAKIYQQKLKLPDRAIEIWQSYRELCPEDTQATVELENLYLETKRFDQLVTILESSEDEQVQDSEQLRRLLVKGLALSEGLRDTVRARAVFDQLHDHLPLLASHLPSYCRFVRGLDVSEKAIGLLRNSRVQAGPEDQASFFQAWKDLRNLAPASMSDLVEALDEERSAQPEDEQLFRMRVDFAREREESDFLIELLSSTHRCEDKIEASERCLASGDKLEQAQELATAAQSLLHEDDEPSVGARLARVCFQLALANKGEAISALRTLDEALLAIQDHETAADYWVEAANALAAEPEYAKLAGQAYERALDRVPSHPGARLQLAQLAIAQGDPQQAEAMLSDIVNRPPAPEEHGLYVQASIDLARLKSDQKAHDEARSILLASFRLLPTKIALRVALAEQCLVQKRWRDLISSADQLDTQLARTPQEDAESQPLIARLYELSAVAERALGRPKGALARLEQALEYDRDRPKTLHTVVELAQELDRSEKGVAAREQLACVYATDPLASGHQLLLGALELFEAANRPVSKKSIPPKSGSSHTLEPESGLDRVEQRQARAVRLLESGLSALTKVEDPSKLPFSDLERALVRCSSLAPGCIPALVDLVVQREDLAPQRRFELHLDAGQRLFAPQQQNSQEGAVQAALAHAKAAVKERPSSAQAQLLLVQTQEQLGLVEPMQATLLEALAMRPEGQETDPNDAVERQASVELLKRTAQSHPEDTQRVLESLARVHQLAPTGLSMQERHLLASAQKAHPEHPFASQANVLENQQALVQLDPTAVEHLSGVLAAQKQANSASADYIEQVLACAQDDEAALRNFETKVKRPQRSFGPEVGRAREISDQPFATAFAVLWEHAREIVFEFLEDRRKWSPDESLTPSSDSNRAMGYGYAQAKLQSPLSEEIPTFVSRGVSEAQGIAFVADLKPWFAMHPETRTCQDPLRHTFLWTRALFQARPEHALSCGLAASDHADLVAAILLAFHPRHTRRRHQARQNEDRASRLGLALARKLPIRSARAVTKAFKEAPYSFFASDQWLKELRYRSQELALLTSGSIRSAVYPPTPSAWASACQDPEDPTRELTAFFMSEAFAAAVATASQKA